jgi:hypothetical protein
MQVADQRSAASLQRCSHRFLTTLLLLLLLQLSFSMFWADQLRLWHAICQVQH